MNGLRYDVRVTATIYYDTSPGDDKAVLVTEVLDQNGDPASNLKVSNFRVWELGVRGLSEPSVLQAQDLGTIEPNLEGVYHLILDWQNYSECQTSFTVVVTKTIVIWAGDQLEESEEASLRQPSGKKKKIEISGRGSASLNKHARIPQ